MTAPTDATKPAESEPAVTENGTENGTDNGLNVPPPPSQPGGGHVHTPACGGGGCINDKPA
ncbi:MAG TPA: hypothetical protein VJT49_17200 [Amycolatopsis sp.]|uniref:hypothetical protein n=1 Tax=Amycolatopsis sp. TaxID=37632 RepID=UPI002B49D7B9|nr:hypothetical protein [Amycolatopsis sp.]HKS46811.1 hypothetical protein [Amycolatopsis sp.]